MAYNFEGITILIIEENPALLTLTSDILKIFGVGNIITAKDGEQGFKRFMDYNPDIIITELSLNKVDGPEMIEKIRSTPHSPNPYVPVIVVTAFSELKRIEAARDAGVNEIMTKPFTARDLYARIAHVIEHPRQFVITDNFLGPDRRRRRDTFYTGPRKRKDDPGKPDITDQDRKKKGFSIYTGKSEPQKTSSDKKNGKSHRDEDIDIDFL